MDVEQKYNLDGIRKRKVVLSIDVGTKNLGVAVLSLKKVVLLSATFDVSAKRGTGMFAMCDTIINNIEDKIKELSLRFNVVKWAIEM